MKNLILRTFIPALLLIAASFQVHAQIKEITFGKIPQEDLEMTEYLPDISADAIILENHAKTVLSSREDILVITDCHVRIKIMNTDGLDYANVEIPYGGDEKIYGLKAASYNLEDGSVVQTLVDRKSLYYEKTSNYRNTLRFSVPNVKPGTVIEYRYTHESTDYFSLYSFKFQEEIPVMRCTFRVEFPEYFDYKFVTGGDFHNIIYRYERRKISFGSSFMDGFEGSWTGSNIPAFREEPFSTGSEDYYSQIGFELSKINIPGYYFEDVSPTYPKLSELLMKRTDFGGYLSQSSAVKKKAEEIKAQGGSETEILRRIFTYISEYMMWNGSSHFTSTESMSKIYKEARGNSADINLMLLAMLRIAGLQADPVIFSTRENGMVNPVFAIIQRFNNVAVVASADGKQYIIDATDPLRPFNMLPLECLNGEGWLVRNSGGSWVDLTNGEHYSQAIDLDLALDENGVMTGKSTAIYESYDAWQVRKLCSLFGTETYRDYVQSDRSNLKISDLHLENLENLEEPVIEKITFTIPDASHTNQTIIYLNPVVSDRVESNEFYADERISMIDLACCSVRKYSCTITIPDGWKVAELPQSVRLNLDGGGAVFSYDIKAEGRTIKLESEISFTTTTYFPEKYNSIRNFYSSIIRKQSEVVILTKEI